MVQFRLSRDMVVFRTPSVHLSMMKWFMVFRLRYTLKEGDIVSIDCGVILEWLVWRQRLYLCSWEITEELQRLLEFTRASLEEGVKEAADGNRVGDISWAVQ